MSKRLHHELVKQMKKRPKTHHIAAHLDKYQHIVQMGKIDNTFEQDVELHKRAKNGDRAAADQLIANCIRLVIKFAIGYKTRADMLDDLISEGLIGVAKAIEKYNPSHKTKFVTYATWWARAYMTRYVKYSWSMVSSHSNDRKDDYVHGIYDVSLDVTLSNDTNTTAIDMLEDENIIDPDDDMHSRNIECTVLDTVFRLPMRHRRVLLERRITEKPKSYEAIGKERARPVSREFVRLEELAALKVFKDVYRHHYPDYAAEYEGKKEVA